jgi:hypothetical protein
MFGRSDKPLCPHDKKPCVKEKCMGWQTGSVEKTVDGVKQTAQHSDCYLIWNLLYLKGIALRTDGTQYAVESFRNQMVKDNKLMLTVVGNTKLVGEQ